MRDPNRLYKFYNELTRIHHTYVPDWRFAQMIHNIFGHEDIFYLEENDVLKRIKAYFNEREE